MPRGASRDDVAEGSCLVAIARTHARDLDRPAGAQRQHLGLPAQEADNRGADGAETGDTDTQGSRHSEDPNEAKV